MSAERPTAGGLHYERLHRRAQELLSTGALPRKGPTRIFGGFGSCFTCALCGAPILQSEVEYELLFESADDENLAYRFHLRCHQIWDYERHRAR